MGTLYYLKAYLNISALTDSNISGKTYKQIHVYNTNVMIKQEIILAEEEDDIAKTTLRIPNSILRELKHLGIDDNKTLTEIITKALSEYVNKRKGKKV